MKPFTAAGLRRSFAATSRRRWPIAARARNSMLRSDTAGSPWNSADTIRVSAPIPVPPRPCAARPAARSRRSRRASAHARQEPQPSEQFGIRLHELDDGLSDHRRSGRHSPIGTAMVEAHRKVQFAAASGIAGLHGGVGESMRNGAWRGLHIMETEFARVSTMTPLPQFYAGLLAEREACRRPAGTRARAAGATLNAVTEPGVGAYLPEIHRLRGECLLRLIRRASTRPWRNSKPVSRLRNSNRPGRFSCGRPWSLARAFAATGTPDKGVTPLHEAVGAFNAKDDYPDFATARFLAAASH